MESLQEVATFSDEFRWSLELAGWSAAVATLLAWCLVSWQIPRWLTLVGAVLLGVALAMPGPLVNLTILRLLDWDGSSAWRALGERTLLPPILAVQFRCLPLACGILWLTKRAFEKRNGELWRLERAMPWRVRQGIWFRYAATAAATCLLTVFFVAFGELSSYLLVLPPGVTTIAMRMFDLLHYGARNSEASLALVLALLAAGPSLWLSHRLSSMSAA
jgi:ABC-type Fe3+ transport system permease subunit